jgi:hypothetical protein
MPSHPELGALGVAYTAMRAMQVVALITMIGLSGNFVSETVDAGYYAPAPLVGALVISCLATLYVAINYILYWDYMLPMLIAGGADACFLVMSIVVSVLVGKPVSYLACKDLPDKGNTANFISSLFENVKNLGSNVYMYTDPDKAACYEVKAVWGLCIALCILFFFSAAMSLCLWRRLKPSSRSEPKDVEY